MDPLRTRTQLYVKATKQNGATQIPNTLFDAYHDLCLSSDELVLLQHIMRIHQSLDDTALTCVEYLAKKTKRSQSEIEQTLNNLAKKDFLRIVRDENTVTPDDISVDPLYAKLLGWTPVTEEETAAPDLAPLFNAYEEYFGHMNVYEHTMLSRWLNDDRWTPDILMEALQIASLKRIKSISYIDAILRNWREQGYTALAHIREGHKRYYNPPISRSGPETEDKEKQNESALIMNILITAFPDLGSSYAFHRLKNMPPHREGEICSFADEIARVSNALIVEIASIISELRLNGRISSSEKTESNHVYKISYALRYANPQALSQVANGLAAAQYPIKDLVELFLAYELYFEDMDDLIYQQLVEWLNKDHWTPSRLLEALFIAIEKQVRGTSYINGILENWKRKRPTTFANRRT